MAMMKDDISHEEYRSKLANVADLAVSYINTGNGYFFGCVMLSISLPNNAEPTRASMMKQLSAEENFLPSLFALSAFHD